MRMGFNSRKHYPPLATSPDLRSFSILSSHSGTLVRVPQCSLINRSLSRCSFGCAGSPFVLGPLVSLCWPCTFVAFCVGFFSHRYPHSISALPHKTPRRQLRTAEHSKSYPISSRSAHCHWCCALSIQAQLHFPIYSWPFPQPPPPRLTSPCD